MHIVVVSLDNSTVVEYDAEEAPTTGDTIILEGMVVKGQERCEVLGRGWIIGENQSCSCKVVVRSIDN